MVLRIGYYTQSKRTLLYFTVHCWFGERLKDHLKNWGVWSKCVLVHLLKLCLWTECILVYVDLKLYTFQLYSTVWIESSVVYVFSVYTSMFADIGYMIRVYSTILVLKLYWFWVYTRSTSTTVCIFKCTLLFSAECVGQVYTASSVFCLGIEPSLWCTLQIFNYTKCILAVRVCLSLP